MKNLLFGVGLLWALPAFAEDKPVVYIQGDGVKSFSENIWYVFDDRYQCVTPCEFYVLEMELDGARITLGKGGKIVGPFVAKDKDGKIILSIPSGETMEETK